MSYMLTRWSGIGRVKEYPQMHYFVTPRNTMSITFWPSISGNSCWQWPSGKGCPIVWYHLLTLTDRQQPIINKWHRLKNNNGWVNSTKLIHQKCHAILLYHQKLIHNETHCTIWFCPIHNRNLSNFLKFFN